MDQLLRYTNFVYRADLGCAVNLQTISKKYWNLVYAPEKFNGLIWRHRKIPCTCIVFTSGRLILNGLKSDKDAQKYIRQYARLIEKVGFKVRLTAIKKVTGSAVYQLSGCLNYHNLALKTGALYEPEIFNGLRWSVNGVHFTIFRSGKVIITGIKTDKDLSNTVRPVLLELEIHI